MMGTFALAPDETLLLEIEPPDTRYWNVTLENIWHECIEPRRRHSSVTNRGVSADADGKVRIAIGAKDFGHGHWLDTGGRHRGFVILRWLDNPEPPVVAVSVRVSTGRFDPDTLIAQACEAAGSDDFGEPDGWRDGLALLADGLARRVPPERPRRRDRRHGHRRAADQPTTDHAVAQGESRGRGGADRAAHLHRRPATHRHHHPVRPARPGPRPAAPADVGGRRPVAAPPAGDLRHRSQDRADSGQPRDVRADRAGTHGPSSDGGVAPAGVRAHLGRAVLQHDLPRPVPAADVLAVDAVRRRSSECLSLPSNLPAVLAVRRFRAMAAEVTRPPVAARHTGRRVSRCRHRADPPRPAERHLVDRRP